jgi:hypothetical protein
MIHGATTGMTSGRRWRKPVLVAASLALHGLVLGYLALTAVGVGVASPDSLPRLFIPVQLEPRPLLTGEKARVPTPPPPRTPSTVRTAPATAAPVGPRPDEDEPRPAPPTPRLALPVPGVPATEDGWRVRTPPPGTAGNLRAGSLGCSLTRARQGAAEQAACDERFGAAALGAAPISGSGNPARDARFAREGARALAAYEERRRPLSGGVGVVGPGDCPGSNFGTGCSGALLDPSLQPDSTTNIHTRRDERQARDRGD